MSSVQNQNNSILRVSSVGGGGGTAVLIAPQWALSAAHVFSNLDSATYQIGADSIWIDVDSIILHPQFHPQRDSAFVDLALVHLARPMKHIRPAAIAWTRLPLGQRVVSVGYGRMTAAREGEASAPGTRHAFENILDTTLTSQPLPLEGIMNGGDSGGGLFIQTGQGWALAGIASTTRYFRERLEQFAKYGWYGNVSFWTRLDAEQAWVVSHVPTAREGGGS